MRDLKTLREDWTEIARAENNAVDLLSIEQSVLIYISLYDAMASQLDMTEDIFRPDRELYLTELQARLRRLAFQPAK